MDEKIKNKLDFLHTILPDLTSEQIIDYALLFFSLRAIAILEEEGAFEDWN